MPKHKTRNAFYKFGSKYNLLMKFGQFISYYKIKKLFKHLTKTATLNLVPGPFVFTKN